jgi:hypothetical protein
MPEVTFRNGTPKRVDYTPTGGNVSAGQVVLLGNTAGLTCGIAPRDITNSTLGALEVGDGVYDVTMLGNYAAWTKVYWDDANNKVTTTSTNNAQFGYLSEGGTGANTVVKCLHNPMA